jgi:hypothetical protein
LIAQMDLRPLLVLLVLKRCNMADIKELKEDILRTCNIILALGWTAFSDKEEKEFEKEKRLQSSRLLNLCKLERQLYKEDHRSAWATNSIKPL